MSNLIPTKQIVVSIVLDLDEANNVQEVRVNTSGCATHQGALRALHLGMNTVLDEIDKQIVAAQAPPEDEKPHIWIPGMDKGSMN